MCVTTEREEKDQKRKKMGERGVQRRRAQVRQSEEREAEARINASSLAWLVALVCELRKSGSVFHLHRINDARGNGSKQHQSL